MNGHEAPAQRGELLALLAEVETLKLLVLQLAAQLQAADREAVLARFESLADGLARASGPAHIPDDFGPKVREISGWYLDRLRRPVARR